MLWNSQPQHLLRRSCPHPPFPRYSTRRTVNSSVCVWNSFIQQLISPMYRTDLSIDASVEIDASNFQPINGIKQHLVESFVYMWGALLSVDNFLDYQYCYDYHSYDFYRDISELSYRIFIAIFPVHAVRYISTALALCKHDRFTTSLLKFQHASITCCERCDACDCHPATVAEQLLCPRKTPQLPLK